MRPLGRLLALALLLPACGDDDQVCGNVLDAGTSGVQLTVASAQITFGNFDSAMANDCDPDSVTITGHQLDPAPTMTFRLAFCLRDRHAVGASPIPLTELVSFFVAAEAADGCIYANDQDQDPSGTVTFSGFCAAGGEPFAMTFAATIPGRVTCPADGGAPTPMPATLELGGSASATPF